MNQYPPRIFDPSGTIYFDVDPPMPYLMGPYMGLPYDDRAWNYAPRTRKRPFHGGSLETQKEWERSKLCCFHLQGRCQYGSACRFSHEDDGAQECQFEGHCKYGHNKRAAAQHPSTPQAAGSNPPDKPSAEPPAAS